MLQPYRRHTKSCDDKRTKAEKPLPKLSPKDLRKCQCPLWVGGTRQDGKEFRQTLNTADLLVASQSVQQLELGKPLAVAIKEMGINDAFEKYKVILRNREVEESSIYYFHTPILNSLVRFAEGRNLKNMSQVTADFLDDLVATWGTTETRAEPLASRGKRIITIKDFFDVAMTRKWIAENPAMHLESIKQKSGKKKTLPFKLATEEPQIVAAIPRWHEGCTARVNNLWCKHIETGAALLYVLRYTGLRISDAIKFEPRDLVLRTIKGKEVYRYYLPEQQKTDEPVSIVIEKEIGDYILKAPRLTERYAFYDTEGTENESKDRQMKHAHAWQGRIADQLLKPLEVASDVSDIRCHRFRDTFAVYCLTVLKLSMGYVSAALGHSDEATTSRYYSHFVQETQDEADSKMVEAWEARDKSFLASVGISAV